MSNPPVAFVKAGILTSGEGGNNGVYTPAGEASFGAGAGEALFGGNPSQVELNGKVEGALCLS